MMAGVEAIGQELEGLLPIFTIAMQAEDVDDQRGVS